VTPGMTEQDGEAIIGPAKIPTTGTRGQPLKIAQYIEKGRLLMDAVDAYRAARDAATIGPAEGEASAEGLLLQSATGAADCNKPTKRKSYPLPPLTTPTEIPGFPLRDPAGQDGEAIIGPAKVILGAVTETNGSPVSVWTRSSLRWGAWSRMAFFRWRKSAFENWSGQ
jgi:hypothetical protein